MRRAHRDSLRHLLSGCFLAAVLGTSGCVERILQVRSDPPGATVHINGKMAGKTPLDHPFSFYGTVDVTFREEGYLSHRELKPLRPPWFEVFPLDIVSELCVPWTIRDLQEMEVELAAAPERIGEEEERALEKEAAELRGELKGKRPPQ